MDGPKNESNKEKAFIWVLRRTLWLRQGYGPTPVEASHILTTLFSMFPVPSASMTRLMRSRTASGSSVTSLEGPRSRSHTSEGPRSRSHTSEGSRSRSHTSEDARLNITPNSGATGNNAGPKSMEVSC